MYATLEQFENDVYTVFGKAIDSNSPDSIPYKEAVSMREQAKQVFQSLKYNPTYSELELSAWHQEYFDYRKKAVYSKVSGEPVPDVPMVDVSSKEFYGEGYDDSDKRIPDMTIINKQLGWNPKTSLWDLLEWTLTYQHRTYHQEGNCETCCIFAPIESGHPKSCKEQRRYTYRPASVLTESLLTMVCDKSEQLVYEIPGVPRIKDKYNPATWMLEASSIAAEVRLGIDFAESYKSSALYQRNKALVNELSQPAPNTSDLYFPTKYSQSSFGQFKSCLWKQWWTYWRSPDYNLVRFFFTLFTALLLGTIFWKIGHKRENSNDLRIVIGSMYAAVLFVGINNCSSVQPIVAVERTVFYRERANVLQQILCKTSLQFVEHNC